MSSVNIETVTISYALHYRAARDYANSPIVYIYTLTIQIRRNVNLNIHSFQRMDIWFSNIFHRTYIFIRNWEKFRRIRLIQIVFFWKLISSLLWNLFQEEISIQMSVVQEYKHLIQVSWFMKIQISYSNSLNKFIPREINNRFHLRIYILAKKHRN